jgi:hypothetical protein
MMPDQFLSIRAMMQFLLLTSLQIGGQEISYKLYFDPREQKYFYKPEAATLRYPSFYVWQLQGAWNFEPLSDTCVQSQAAQQIEQLLAVRKSGM